MALLTPIYDEELQLAMMEALVQNIDVLNGSSNGAILMGTGDFFGNFQKDAFYDRIADLVVRRDIESTSAAAASGMSLIEDVEVNLDYRVRAKESEENFKRRGRSVDEFVRMVGTQMAEDLVKRYLNLNVGALTAAVGANAGMSNATLNTATAGIDHLLKADELFGERYGDVRAYLMNAASFHAIRKDEANNYQMDNVAGNLIVTGLTATMGKPVIVTNSPLLTYDDTGAQRNRIMALTEGAITMTERGDRATLIERDGGGENISTLVAVDGTIKCGLKGYAYDDATAGKSPTDAVYQTASSWNKIVENELTAASMVEALA